MLLLTKSELAMQNFLQAESELHAYTRSGAYNSKQQKQLAKSVQVVIDKCIHQFSKMRKTVICIKCKVPFQVEGSVGSIEEMPNLVTCPHPDCQQLNEIGWPVHGSCKAVAIYKRQATQS
jgi:hypothetical protein